MITFRISDMTCGHCAGTIARAIADVDKDARVEVDVPEKLFRIASAADESELVEAIRDAGYTPEKVGSPAAGAPRPASGCGCGCGPRKASPVDTAQAAAATGDSCCG